MVEKLIEKCSQLEKVLLAFKEKGGLKEDEPTLKEAVKIILKEISEIICLPESK